MDSKFERKKAIIIGATSPIAQKFIELLAKENFQLLLISRDENELKNIQANIKVKYDIESEIQIADISDWSEDNAREVINSNLHTNLLAIFSGAMGSENLRDIESVTKINYQSPALISGIFAEVMSERKQAADLVIISSVAGERGKKSNFIYGAAKSALTEFTSGLRAKYFKDNINILTVLPGFIDTSMTYGKIDSGLMASPEKAAKDIFKAYKRKKDVIYTPFFWRYIMLMIKTIPEFTFKRLGL